MNEEKITEFSQFIDKEWYQFYWGYGSDNSAIAKCDLKKCNKAYFAFSSVKNINNVETERSGQWKIENATKIIHVKEMSDTSQNSDIKFISKNKGIILFNISDMINIHEKLIIKK